MTDITKRLAEALRAILPALEQGNTAQFWDGRKALDEYDRQPSLSSEIDTAIESWHAGGPPNKMYEVLQKLRARPAPEPTVRYRSPRNMVTSRPLGVPSDYTFSEPQTLEELRAELDPTPAPDEITQQELDDCRAVEARYEAGLPPRKKRITPNAPAPASGEVTDAEVEAACIAYIGAKPNISIPRMGIAALTWENCGQPWRDNAIKEMRAALEAALNPPAESAARGETAPPK